MHLYQIQNSKHRVRQSEYAEISYHKLCQLLWAEQAHYLHLNMLECSLRSIITGNASGEVSCK